MKLVYYPNEILKRECEIITDITDEIILLAEEMAQVMYSNGGWGLAANQVGANKKLILVDTSYNQTQQFDLKVLINPVITDQHDEIIIREGCLSFPGIGVSVKRAKDISVKACDIDNNEISFDATGALSICIQHEIDHINGITFFDRISKVSKKLAEERLKKWKKKILRTKK